MLEVETYRQLAETALDRTVVSVASPDAWFLKGAATAATLRRVLVGHRFTAARRIGKLLLLDVDSGPTLGIRFGMTGTLAVDGTPGVEQMRYAPKRRDPVWDRWRVRFEDGGSLVVHDPRRLGGVLLDPDVSGLGPDATTITPAQLAATLGRSKAPLKACLLDQSRVAGIGNLIVDELLWRAGLSPLRPSDTPDPERGQASPSPPGSHPLGPGPRGWIPYRPSHGRAAAGRAVSPRRGRADPVQGRRAHLMVVFRPPAMTPGPGPRGDTGH